MLKNFRREFFKGVNKILKIIIFDVFNVLKKCGNIFIENKIIMFSED